MTGLISTKLRQEAIVQPSLGLGGAVRLTNGMSRAASVKSGALVERGRAVNTAA